MGLAAWSGKEADRPIRHIDFRLKGLYKTARLANKREAMTGIQAHHKHGA